MPNLDENKAYIIGLLHDIGRRVGIVNIPKHVYEGYKYSTDKGWDEVAKICMTHSYPLMKEEFNYEPTTEEEIHCYVLLHGNRLLRVNRCTTISLYVCLYNNIW